MVISEPSVSQRYEIEIARACATATLQLQLYSLDCMVVSGANEQLMVGCY